MRDGPGARATRPPGGDLVRMVAVPVLVVAVAALGTWRVRHQEQTAWRGATIGMFAHVDAPANRLVRGVVTGTSRPDEEPFLVLAPGAVGDVLDRATVTPTSANLRDLHRAWSPLIDDGTLVRVEVWATRFSVDDGRPGVRMELLRAHGSADGGPS